MDSQEERRIQDKDYSDSYKVKGGSIMVSNFYGTKIKTGALSKQLGIPISKNIPISMLNKIKAARIGSFVSVNGKHLKVTPTLKKRVQFAINSKRWSK